MSRTLKALFLGPPCDTVNLGRLHAVLRLQVLNLWKIDGTGGQACREVFHQERAVEVLLGKPHRWVDLLPTVKRGGDAVGTWKLKFEPHTARARAE
jgi:hypothetical protein